MRAHEVLEMFCSDYFFHAQYLSCMHPFFKASASSFHGWDDESGGVLSNHPPVTGTGKDWKEYSIHMHTCKYVYIYIHKVYTYIRKITPNMTVFTLYYEMAKTGTFGCSSTWFGIFRQNKLTPRMSIHPAGGHRARHPRARQRWRCWSQRSNSKLACAFQAFGRCKSKKVYN